MTTTSVTPSHIASRSIPLIGVATALVAVGWSFYGAHSWAEIAVTSAAAATCAALVFGRVVPRALRRESAGGTALALSVPAVLLTFPAFWSGLPFVLGVAGMVVGNAGRTARTGAAASIAGLVLGALAALGYLAIFVLDGVVAGHAGFLFD